MIHLSSLTLKVCFHRFSVHTAWQLELPNQLQTSNLACTNQHLMGQPPVCPCHRRQHWNAEEESNPLAGQGRLKALSVKGWAGLLWRLSALDEGPGEPAWRGPGTELVTLPEVPGGRNLTRALLPEATRRLKGDTCDTPSRSSYLQNHPMTKHSLTVY